MTTFEKKTVLITGGTSGIGKATALAFAKEGANVVVSGLRVAEGEQVAREITSTGQTRLVCADRRYPGRCGQFQLSLQRVSALGLDSANGHLS